MVFTTFWGKGADGQPLYSDWEVSFITGGADLAGKDADEKDDSDSVSTQSLSEEDSIVSGKSASEGRTPPDAKDSGKKVFSIHRNMVGPKSEFFTKRFDEDETSTVISLPSDLPAHSFQSVLDAFEILLDYCYVADIRKEKISTDNAVALFCLCNYLEMEPEACKKVNDFIASDLSHETVAKYYQIIKDLRGRGEQTCGAGFSVALNAEPIMKTVVAMCYKDPTTLSSSTDLFQIADLSLFLSIGALLAEDDETTAEASKAWSENLTAFFNTYEEEDVLDLRDSFRTLTSEKILSEVSPRVALRLLEHELKHGLSSLTRRIVKSKQAPAAQEVDRVPSDDADGDESTVDTAGDSDLEIVIEEELLGAENITSLQRRCIKALCESDWNGEENDIERKRGELVTITTPPVLEALLIDSVTGARALAAKMEEMTSEREVEKKVLKNEIDAYEFKKEETKVEVAKEKQKQQSLQHELDKLRRDHEKLQASYKRSQEKSVSVHTELCKANAILEAELEKEKKKSRSLDQKYSTVKRSQSKIETDREMYELTVRDTIKRLDAMTSYDEAGGCGLGTLVFLISALSDHDECAQIKAMLEQVVKDPLIYERNYLMKNVEEQRDQSAEEDSTIQIIQEPSYE
eukprot:CAMPEP_0197184000 /NCGR_PEP_ID=MMETSP1423-20130617/8952_1 /TAXON_ID=476441 /ORGANISM="Pseudo-nitzschia heimii, Strain UNC1101" /LENGTH=632 /DNA_ID=CAMNT_0042634699 /DNA_START=74 /DNA_END=1972 /DNA_ORIENTATION=+